MLSFYILLYTHIYIYINTYIDEDDNDGEDLPKELSNPKMNEIIDAASVTTSTTETPISSTAATSSTTSTTFTTSAPQMDENEENHELDTEHTSREVVTNNAAPTAATTSPTTPTTTPPNYPTNEVSEDDDEGGAEEIYDENDDEDDDDDDNNNESNDLNRLPPDDDCGADRGGCDHECRRVFDNNDPNDRVGRAQCACRSGFTLDDEDQRTCHGKNNGSCAAARADYIGFVANVETFIIRMQITNLLLTLTSNASC